MPIIYSFREPPRILNAKLASAQRIGEAIQKHIVVHNGLDDEKLLVEASDPKHVLYQHLLWDDAEAAHRYRLDQLGSIIRIIEQRERRGDPPRRSFISLATEDGRQYKTIGEILNSADLQTLLMEQAKNELEAWTRRYQDLADICGIVRKAASALGKQIAAGAKPGRRSKKGEQGEARI